MVTLDGNKIIVFTPQWDSKGKKDATGAFQPEAKAFAKLHNVPDTNIHIVDNHLQNPAMREFVINKLKTNSYQFLAMFCHGWTDGIQFGFNRKNLGSLASELLSDPYVRVVLYACSTGSPNAVGGDGGFADILRDTLCKKGAVCCQVDAHTTAGHCSRNPYVRRFLGGGYPEGGTGGEYLITPNTSLWKKWIKAMQGDMRLKFPFMPKEEILLELGE